MYLFNSSGMFVFPLILFFVMFALVMGVIIYTLVSHVARERKNDRSPRITVPASVVAKRTQFSASSRRREMYHTGRTFYFATFQLESGDRMELSLQGEEYGLLVEGDQGKLTFQGTRFLSFDRM